LPTIATRKPANRNHDRHAAKPAPTGSQRTPRLRFHLYTVKGTYRDKRVTFHVVCCHESDARTMIVERLPEIDNLTVQRRDTVHYIVIGDHALHE